MYFETKGAYTGAVSVSMLQSVGAELVLVGHSERRSVFGESDGDVNRSLKQVLTQGMVPVLCVGETLQEFEQGKNCNYIHTIFFQAFLYYSIYMQYAYYRYIHTYILTLTFTLYYTTTITTTTLLHCTI